MGSLIFKGIASGIIICHSGLLLIATATPCNSRKSEIRSLFGMFITLRDSD